MKQKKTINKEIKKRHYIWDAWLTDDEFKKANERTLKMMRDELDAVWKHMKKVLLKERR